MRLRVKMGTTGARQHSACVPCTEAIRAWVTGHSEDTQPQMSASGPGWSSPRCAKARLVAARPRGVRSISPR